MISMADKFEYSYPVEELDKMLEKMSKGIEPMGLSDDFKNELKIRYMELNEASLDDDEYDDYQTKKEDVLKKQIEKKRREATKNDVIIIKLTDEQKQTLTEEMSASIVRENPNLMYHMSDDQIFDSDEKRILYHKLSRLKNCYYTQADYVAAIRVIYEAIEYSLEHDYPWLTREEAIKAFNNGEIKFSYCNIPKLYINWNTQITDPSILKGIMTGEVVLKTKEESEPVRKRHVDYKPIHYDYTITGSNQYNDMLQLQQRGYDTPIAPALKAKNGAFNRFALPGNNRFYVDASKTNTNIPQEFDWMHEGAGKEYYNLVNNVKYGIYDIVRDVNVANNNQLNQVLSTNAANFLRALKTSGTEAPQPIIQPLSVNEKSVELERSILDAMRRNNPNL